MIMTAGFLQRWYHKIFLDLFDHFKWSYLPPLMVYLAAGISGLTSIVGVFFLKEYSNLSAEFIAALGFWVGLPWALKMPLGHLVDLIWRWKALLVYLGSALIALSISIMYGLVAHTVFMQQFMSIEAWYVLSALLSPIGYVVQDIVADAMTVEAVGTVDEQGQPYSEETIKVLHTTMQTLGRFSIISGFVLIGALNIFMFSDVETMSQAQKAAVYADVYLIALVIPLISVSGVVLNSFLIMRQRAKLRAAGFGDDAVQKMTDHTPEDVKPNWWIFGGSAVFVAFTLVMGLSDVPYAQEIIFIGSAIIIVFLMHRLIEALSEDQARVLIGTAVIIFVFRAVPLPGAGLTWFEIDELGFDQRFLSILLLISYCLTLFGMLVLRPMMARKSIVYIVIFLTFAAGILSLPNIGLYYGIHEWTSSWSGGVVDARFIAIMDTAMESPLGQILMIPMLAWIAKNAPANLKATFFAVMASFTNLALSASSLGTKYLYQIFTVTREIKGKSPVAADYSELGVLLLSVAGITVIVPLLAVWLIQTSRFKTSE